MSTATKQTAQKGGKPGATNPEGPAAAAAAAAPAEKKVRKTKTEKILWGVRDEEGKLVNKIVGTKAPADFNPALHKPLWIHDFANKADFLDYRAEQWEKHAAEMRQMAIDERNGVSGTSVAAKQKKLVTLKSKYEALMAELKAAGVDTDAALAG